MRDFSSNLRDFADIHGKVWGSLSLNEGEEVRFDCPKSVGLHLVQNGPVTLRHDGIEQVLNSGDFVLVPKGRSYSLGSGAATGQPIPIERFQHRAWRISMNGGHSVLSSAYQVHPLLSRFSDIVIVPKGTIPNPIPSTIEVLGTEVSLARDAPLGGNPIVGGVVDVLFAQLLRHCVNLLSQGSTAGPIKWLSDARLARCLQIMHDDLQRPWKLQDLAYEIGQSKAWLSANFRKAVGMAPIEYLTELRVQKSMELLSRTDAKIEAIARTVGYQDAFGFSKAFHRVAGLSPREFRKKGLEDEGQ